MPYINQPGGGGSGGAISGVTVTGAGAAGKVPVASSAAAGTWAFPPGFEINYTQITAPVNVVSTTEATGTTIISPGAIVFDGTAVLVEFFACTVKSDTSSTGDTTILSLFESSTQITRMAVVEALSIFAPNNFVVAAKYRFTPTAASHTYTITASTTSTSGTPAVLAGSGGTGGYPPAFVRFTKV
jgi:hypothetical protein